MNKLLSKSDHHYNLIYNADIFNTCVDILKLSTQKTVIIIPHVCNNLDIFGGGFAKAIGDRFPEVKENYHLLGKNFLKNNFGYSQFIHIKLPIKTESRLVACNMICQDGFVSKIKHRALHYGALVSSMYKIKKYVEELKIQCKDDVCSIEIHAPKFGSGIAGGNWNFISELIQDIWKDIPTFIYQFSK